MGVRGLARNCDSELQCFQLFITDEMIDIVVTNTNKNIDDMLTKLKSRIDSSDKYPYLKHTTRYEVLAFIGLMYYRGLYNLTGISTKVLFSETQGIPMFGAVMSRNRFVFLLSNIGFDDKQSRPDRWNEDRFAAFRHFFELFNDNCSTYLTPRKFLFLVETLYSMRHQAAFRQYNPDKPAKYGMLFKSINAAGIPYLYRTVVYAGKPVGESNKYPNISQVTQQNLKGTANYVKSLVNNHIVMAYKNMFRCKAGIFQWIVCIHHFRLRNGCCQRILQ